jgi:serine/threonine-protein kinase
MSDNNDFLSNYGKGQPEESVVVRETPLPSYKYEQKSDFKPPERGEAPPPPGYKKLIIGIAASAVALIAVVLVLVLLLNRGAVMENLVGWTQTDANLWAKDNNVTLQATEVYNDEYDAGVVFYQSVAEGERVKKNDFVQISVSKGHDPSVTLSLPDLKTMTMSEVQAWADENFMTKVRITTEYSDTVPLNAVISYTVNDESVTGDTVRRDSPIYVVVSKGPEDQAAIQVTVPDFKTMTLNECQTFASENGLVLTVQEQYDDYAAAGAIISQSVKAQQKVARGTEITLVVSLGKKIVVPDFSDYTSETAVAKAGQLGITATLVEKYSSSSAGAFLSQSIDAGTIYKTGDILELRYSLGNKIVVSSYVGQTRDAIEAWAQGLNEKGAKITINVTYTQSSSAAGVIINQSPANTSTSYKTTINITVSTGKVTYVPDFVADAPGYDGTYATAVTREDAMAMCEATGLVPVFVAEGASGRLPGEVWYQSLPAGSESTQGTTITLKYVPSLTTAVPKFTGMSEADAKAAAHSGAASGDELRIVFAKDSSYIGDGTDVVISQSLTVGSTVAMGTTITLTLGQ